MNITIEQQNKIRDYLKTHHIPRGLGTEEEACSIAAINLCLSGKLTDDIPECMSKVIGYWIIRIQDRMPDSIRNSDKWKELLPLAAGTGMELETHRLKIIKDWMWLNLEQIQNIADKYKFGIEWKEMTTNKDSEYARKAKTAAAVVVGYAAVGYAATAAADAANAAVGYATAAAAAAAAVVGYAAVGYAATAAADAADAAAAAAAAVRYAAAAAAADSYWIKCDPCGLLKKLILVNDK